MQALPRLGDWADLDELRDLQAKQIPKVMEWASRAPFYAGRDLTELTEQPLTTKQNLRDQYPFGMLAVPRRDLATYHESSGTAGQSTPSYYTAEDWIDLAERYARKWVGITPEDTFFVRTPYALMITGHLAQAGARLHGATVVPGDYRSLAMPYARVVQALHDLEVSLTWSIPTEPLVWAATARAAGLDPARDFPALRALFVGGEPLTGARRRRISEIWGVPIVEEYGSTETGSLAGECRHGRMHLWADRMVFEVYDPQTGRISPEGRGQLVVTPLYREAMPLLRYNLEDDVEVSYEDCPCDWRLPSIRVMGRSVYGHPVADGTVTQQQLEEIIFSLPIEHEVLFWRARADRDLLRVQFEVPAEHREAAVARVRAAIADEVGVPAEVTALEPGTLLPFQVLTQKKDVVKPRSLLAAGEDWSKALPFN
ncbi:phenylacetate--CoA ligase family protein [Micromonospora sp. NPDC048871]|uniref:phenylacetate--CoA ligase family protein n=1 Tax=unclassified Micromonospora TaxID=2617518 RepID=UPI002E15D5C5|nr:AMP-binding protein [Micromonospora sp. NBC_01739]